MSNLDFTRCSALNNIPLKKFQAKLADTFNKCETCSEKDIKVGGASDGLCQRCSVINLAFNRYYESNIPLEYWDLKMEKDFQGYEGLKKKYDEVTSDLRHHFVNGTSICFGGGHGVGKQLSLDTELPTPTGFIKLASLKEGDQLFDEQGNICNVTKLHPINLSPESYEIEFDDGNKVKACADHLWLTWTRKNRANNTKPTVKTTKEILQTLKFKNGVKNATNHSIICSKPLNYNSKNLPIDPYLFGLWLGDGDIYNGTIESKDLEMFQGMNYKIVPSSRRCSSKSVAIRVDGLYSSLNKLGFIKRKKSEVTKVKHIPEEYLYAAVDQRLELLRGILDTDGTCLKSGRIEFCTVIPQLADDVCQLIKSLGIKAKVKINPSYLKGKRYQDRYRISFTTTLPVFKLARKLNNLKINKSQKTRTEHRFILNIKKIDPTPMRCITVDSPSHLFLITRDFIPTHNTMTVTCILKKAAQKGFTCLYTTLSDIVNTVTQADGESKFLAKRELVMVDFLVIDEFDPRFMPSENAADLYARSLEGVFRTRSSNKMPTFMCTNSPNVVQSFNGPLRSSIESLVKGYLKEFPVFGEDFRKKKVP